MPRHNLCPNPALGVDVTGWGGSSLPTRTAVSGFSRPWAARYTPPGGFQETVRSAVVPGQVYTLSLEVRVTTTFPNSHIVSYLGWYNSGGGAITFDTLALPDLQPGVVTHVERTGTAPAGAAFVDLVFDSVGGDFVDYTALLVEPVGSSQAYADGDTPGWVWDGTPGLSPSSENPTITLTPDSIDPASAVGSVTLTGTTVTVGPDSIGPTSTVGSPTLVGGPISITPDGIGPAAAVGDVHVFVGIQPDTIASAASVGAPTLSATPATIQPASIVSTARVGGVAINPASQRRESLTVVLGEPRTGWIFGNLEVA